MKPQRVFVYTLRNDGGYAPNPFYGRCTLACCKPQIRRSANVGDWVVGLTTKSRGQRLAYAMHIAEKLEFPEFWGDRRFRSKRPVWGAPAIVRRCGDNCYEPIGDQEYRQLPCCHYDHEAGTEDPGCKRTDLGGRYVLVAEEFCYYGADAVPVPEHLSFMLPGRFYRVNFTDEQQEEILSFIEKLPQGVHGPPALWKDGDNSWRQSCRCG